MRDGDGPIFTAADRAEMRVGVEEKPGAMVDMTSPATRDVFQTNGEQARPAAVTESGQLRFDGEDIYGRGGRDGDGPMANTSDSLGAQAASAVQTEEAGIAAAAAPAAVAGADTAAPATAAGADTTAPATAAGADTAAPAAVAGADTTSPAAVPPVDSATNFSSMATTSDSLGTQAASAALTPEQAAINQSVVQLSTDVVKVGPDGTLTESTSVGTGTIIDNPSGVGQLILTNNHVDKGTGIDPLTGQEVIAEGPTTVTFADGTTTTAHALPNDGSAATNNNSVEISNAPDASLMSFDSNGPTVHPSMPMDSSATPNPGDTVTTVGYGNGNLTGLTEQYLGNLPENTLTNLNDSSPMQVYSGDGIHGMSGSPIVNSDGNMVGIYTQGSNPNNGVGYNEATPLSSVQNLLDGQNPFSPNYLANLFGKQQPIATPDDRGNGSDQSLTGVTVNDGTGERYLTQPTTATPAATDTPATPAAAAPVDDTTAAPATDTSVATPAVPVDTAAASIADSTAAAAVTQPALDTSAVDTSAYTAASMPDYAAMDFGMDYGMDMDMGGF